ncbi:MAG: HEAT repeat domain-containing protein [Caldilineaceae bacterium]|nr:HEAT repeat domain-containing protein [Caldilineaceae bacterium]
MAKNKGKRHAERFEAAAVGDDASAEDLLDLLTPADSPILRQMIESSDLDRRWWGIRALAQVGGEDLVPLVAAYLEDSSPEIRAVVAMALGEIHRREAAAVNSHLPQLALLLQDDDALVRQSAADALAQCGDDAVDLLATALESDREGVRVRAAAALHRIGSMKAAPPLYRHLEDPNPLVRHYAYETLDKLGLLENILLKP